MKLDLKKVTEGLHSRKVKLTLTAMGFILLGELLAVKFDSLRALFETYCGAIVAITALYLTGNVANKYVTKTPTDALKQEESSPKE